MLSKNESLRITLERIFGEGANIVSPNADDIVTIVFKPKILERNMTTLRDNKELLFDQLTDLSGVDYQGFAGDVSMPGRFAVVYHLLSLEFNRRIRVRAFCPEDDFPLLKSLVDVWPAANWYEREAFDLFGIMFEGHPDLRRILTDYGFIGHPFRKDFPISGHVEMRYDPESRRVIYQPVTIEAREIVPRVVRSKSYGSNNRQVGQDDGNSEQ